MTPAFVSAGDFSVMLVPSRTSGGFSLGESTTKNIPQLRNARVFGATEGMASPATRTYSRITPSRLLKDRVIEFSGDCCVLSAIFAARGASAPKFEKRNT
jgi:hypothetical protein